MSDQAKKWVHLRRKQWTGYPRRGRQIGLRGPLLDINKEIPFKDVFAFFVFLGCFVGLIVFPPQCGAALDAIDIADCVVSSSHRSIASLALYDVDNYIK